jgi:putative membrane protein
MKVLRGAAPARNFGTSLVVLGIVMLVLGISYHVAFMLGCAASAALQKRRMDGVAGLPTRGNR